MMYGCDINNIYLMKIMIIEPQIIKQDKLL